MTTTTILLCFTFFFFFFFAQCWGSHALIGLGTPGLPKLKYVSARFFLSLCLQWIMRCPVLEECSAASLSDEDAKVLLCHPTLLRLIAGRKKFQRSIGGVW